MFVIRIVFSKQGRAKYISHLDLVRSFVRIFNRAQIPVSQTHGFNPHPYMVFSAPLSLGVCSQCEMLDIRTDNDMPPEEMLHRMKQTLPSGIDILEVYPQTRPFSEIAYAKYLFGVEKEVAESFQAFLQQPQILVSKKTKSGAVRTIDLKAEMIQPEWSDSDSFLILSMILPCGNTKNIGVNLLSDAFSEYIGKSDWIRSIERVQLLDSSYGIFK